jgi:DNA helicase-2/ATP-dependent DNA helicase PcrA
VVYRTNAQSLGFETEFLRRKIPYRVVGSLKFYEREEVKDTLALLSFLVNPRDEVAFRRMVNKPARGAGLATVDRIVGEAVKEEHNGNLALAAKSLAPELSTKARAGIAAFIKAIESGRAAISTEHGNYDDYGSDASGPAAGNPLAAGAVKNFIPPSAGGLRAGIGLSACVINLVNESGIAEYHLTRDEITGNQRLGNLQEVANAASLYEAAEAGLFEFLEHIELDRSIEEATGDSENVVTLITLHNTKGLELRRVIMTGVEQGIFPREDKSGEDLEEERRLFYVGATRAMDELYLCSCAYRRMFGRTIHMEPSLFLTEVDQRELRIIGSRPPSFGMRELPRRAIPTGLHSSGRKPTVSSDGRWTLGDRVFHSDHGYGSVTHIRESGDGPVVKVFFETGHEKSFLSLHQSSHYTKIKDD